MPLRGKEETQLFCIVLPFFIAGSIAANSSRRELLRKTFKTGPFDIETLRNNGHLVVRVDFLIAIQS